MRNDLNENAGPDAPTAALEDVGRLVKELAHALRKPPQLEPLQPWVPASSAIAGGETRGELPQILQTNSDDLELPNLSTWRTERSRSTGWIGGLADGLGTGVLRVVTGLGAAGLLVLGLIGAIDSFAGLNPRTNEPAAAQLSGDAPPTASALSTEVVRESASMIARGDITGARVLLGQAVEAGEPAAMLALAETYDPNMLAAWGARGQAADVGAAKQLYSRALSAGEPRARQRLQALGETP